MMRAFFKDKQLHIEASEGNDREMLRQFFYDAWHNGVELIGSGDGAGRTVIFMQPEGSSEEVSVSPCDVIEGPCQCGDWHGGNN